MIRLVLWQSVPEIDNGIDFISPTSLVTIGGAILAVVVIVNTTRHVFNWGPKWYALLLALIVSFSVWELDNGTMKEVSTENPAVIESDKKQPITFLSVFLILVNGCLIYTSAFGIQNNVVAPNPTKLPKGGVPTDEEIRPHDDVSTSEFEISHDQTTFSSKPNLEDEPEVRLRFNSSW